jgi:hypothetical protein
MRSVIRCRSDQGVEGSGALKATRFSLGDQFLAVSNTLVCSVDQAGFNFIAASNTEELGSNSFGGSPFPPCRNSGPGAGAVKIIDVKFLGSGPGRVEAPNGITVSRVLLQEILAAIATLRPLPPVRC